MRRTLQQLWKRTDGAVAPTVALSLVGLIAAGGIAFDYARMASMQTELHNAADQAALAAATQLDGKTDAIKRAKAAAESLITNKTLFANDSDANGRNVGSLTFTFYTGYDQATDAFGAETTADSTAKVVRVEVGGRKVYYALTPVVGLFDSGSIGAEAVASVGHAICKTPPVMLCNPAESAGNTNEKLDYNPTPGIGLRLITGDASTPGNFGWLESTAGSGANALAAELGYNIPPGDCQPADLVTTKTGMDTSVLSAFNSRFDVYANGNSTCPNQLGGTCSPSMNTRKDVVCKPNSTTNPTGCNDDKWDEASTPYRLPAAERYLQSGDTYPTTMGYPHDLCHAWPRASQTCGGNNVTGNGDWDRDAYFKVNYGYADGTAWQGATGLSSTASRWQVYQWELAHRTVTVNGVTKGIDAPKVINSNEAAFSYPATGRSGIAASLTQADRRRVSVAVLNCVALKAHGKTVDAPVPTWLDVFLVEPAMSRGKSGSYTDQKDIYVEIIGKTSSNNGVAGQVVRRDVPYLIR